MYAKYNQLIRSVVANDNSNVKVWDKRTDGLRALQKFQNFIEEFNAAETTEALMALQFPVGDEYSDLEYATPGDVTTHDSDVIMTTEEFVEWMSDVQSQAEKLISGYDKLIRDKFAAILSKEKGVFSHDMITIMANEVCAEMSKIYLCITPKLKSVEFEYSTGKQLAEQNKLLLGAVYSEEKQDSDRKIIADALDAMM